MGDSLKHKKIALVEASSRSTHVYSMTYLPRVGIPTMGAILKGLGHKCDLWFQAMSMTADRLRGYDIVGIGSLSSTISEAYRLADFIRDAGGVVVMGGPHATFLPEEALAHCNYVVIGEGDVTFPALVQAIAEDAPPDNIPGLGYRAPDGSVRYTGPAKTVDYENLPSPDFTLSPQVRPERIPPIVATSRGCPHNCTFCSVTAIFGRRYRFKRNDQVIAELRPIQNRSVCFGDDNFCANPARTKSLLQDLIAHKAVPRRWSGQMCVGAEEDDDLLDLMQKTRCRIMYIGVESIKPETLKQFRKAHKDADAAGRCIERLHGHDIGVHGMFVVGLDDDEGTVREIVDYAIGCDLDTIQIFPLIPFPGTAAYEKHKGEFLHRDWDYFDGMHVVVKPHKCSAYDLQMAILREMRRFYSLNRILRAYRSKRGWRVKYRAGGHFLLRRWIDENAGYIERLRTGF